MYLVIEKAARRLTLYQAATPLKSYPIALGQQPIGTKERRGDGRTPEGEYYICTRNDRSRYHLFLGLSYPNLIDAQRGLTQGLITTTEYQAIAARLAEHLRPSWETALGGEIGLHGHGIATDWTAGCIAVTNEVIEELWPLCPLGMKVIILA